MPHGLYANPNGITLTSPNLVWEVQQSLATLAFDPGPVDGIFGRYTHHGIIDYQQTRGFYPDGVITPNLLAYLRHDIRRYVSPAVNYRQISVIRRVPRYSRYGRHGGHGGGGHSLLGQGGHHASLRLVAQVQRYLTILGIDPGPVDGIAGPATARAVSVYQSHHGLVPDGRISQHLMSNLHAEAARRSGPY
ncbi:MAG: peptidoglycan-binding domain-containing protein [Alphaproteobacteria bacterium]|nr:peptidoglycan-binding domain-containing protein [Alphaproteobacteria bacterium]